MLTVSGLTLRFGGVVALNDVSFSVEGSELLAVIGPNGAGKTSLFNCLNGLYRPTAGSIRFGETEIVGMRPAAIARLGVARTFQNLALFTGATVLENVMLGRHHLMHATIVEGALGFGRCAREERAHRATCRAILDELQLSRYADVPIGTLPYGVQKRVEFARALAMEPKLLLLDEPVAGMNHEETEAMARDVLTAQARLRIPVVLVEHDMQLVMDLADRVVVLDFGRVLTIGTPSEVQGDPQVIAAYLGAAS
jgi:branched-chain amino acid transport system ATP-binding protein